jgi:hypothetical protein
MAFNRPSANSGFTSMLLARHRRVRSVPMKIAREVRVGTQRVGLRPAIFLLLAVFGLFACSDDDARKRIGTGPWYNARLQEVAADVDALHENGIPRLLWNVTDDPDGEGLVIDENGGLVPLTEHDIVTGSTMEGTVSAGRTCLDWTSASVDDVAQVGHSDIAPPGFTIPGVEIQSWNSAHDTASCTEQGLAERQGAGRFYCFAID